MNSPKISIIVATYNAHVTLSRALNSILKLSFDEWECIIVDGNSTDNTVEILKYFKSLDSRINYISEPDKGIYDAFNKGWKLAKGEWIYYLGADDQLTNNGLKELIHKMTESYADIMYGNVIYKRGEKLLYRKSNTNIEMIRKFMVCCHQAVIMKKQVIDELNGFDINFKISADYDLLLRAYLNKYKFKYFDINLAVFDSTGVSSRLNFESFKIRKRNSSVNYFLNIYLLLKVSALKILRNLKYSILE